MMGEVSRFASIVLRFLAAACGGRRWCSWNVRRRGGADLNDGIGSYSRSAVILSQRDRPSRRRDKITALLLVCGLLAANAAAQDIPEDHTPRGALVRAFVPGWGQAYNRQYIKLPVVYGALGGLGYAAVRLYGKHQDYRCAYQWKGFEDQVEAGIIEANPRPECEADYDALLAAAGRDELPASTLRTQRDALRRNRDLTILLIGAVYALQVLDAYVSAHLLDFDVSEDLSLRVVPTVRGPVEVWGSGKASGGVGVPVSLGVRVTF